MVHQQGVFTQGFADDGVLVGEPTICEITQRILRAAERWFNNRRICQSGTREMIYTAYHEIMSQMSYNLLSSTGRDWS